MQSSATSVQEYLNELPEDRQRQIGTVRKTILDNLPQGYEEVMNWGMIAYQVPLQVYADTYNKKPLLFAALASQKNYMSLYLSGIYMYSDRQKSFEQNYRKTGKRYDVGKSCVRFRKLDDLPLDLIAETIKSLPMDTFISHAKSVKRKK
ncbi:MAG: DUF1801 domain-containing protein [Candidatus Marinimicrobia bacterium]|nr:DUF1801 domain-containing protein [Candidatus Neomarinimicrobiota bacterium]